LKSTGFAVGVPTWLSTPMLDASEFAATGFCPRDSTLASRPIWTLTALLPDVFSPLLLVGVATYYLMPQIEPR